MFDTVEEIRRQLAAGEDSRAEFKELELGDRSVKSAGTDDLAAELVAFANAEGGTLFLGVDDSGIARGVPDGREADVEGWVINVASNNCDPPVRPLLRRERVQRPDGSDAVVMLVEVRRGLYVHGTSSGRHYVRVGSSKQIVTGVALARLFQERGRAFVFDEQPVPTAMEEDLDHDSMLRFFRTGAPSIPWTDLLRNTKVVTGTDGGALRPTVAGLLAFGRNPRDHLPSAFISAAVYRGERLTSAELVHAEEIGGRVDDQIEFATAFAERFMLRPALKPAGREDHPQYVVAAVHEAIVNAVAHRDYSISGSKIRLFLFADRLEIYSPGSLPNSLTVETMPFRSFTRNQLLVGFLSRMRSRKTGRAFLESRGEGVRQILEASEVHAGRKPIYELFDQELRLTIWAKPSPHGPTGSATA